MLKNPDNIDLARLAENGFSKDAYEQVAK